MPTNVMSLSIKTLRADTPEGNCRLVQTGTHAFGAWLIPVDWEAAYRADSAEARSRIRSLLRPCRVQSKDLCTSGKKTLGGIGVGVMVGVAVGDTVEVGEAVAVWVELGDAVVVGLAVAVGVRLSVAVAVGLAVVDGVPPGVAVAVSDSRKMITAMPDPPRGVPLNCSELST